MKCERFWANSFVNIAKPRTSLQLSENRRNQSRFGADQKDRLCEIAQKERAKIWRMRPVKRAKLEATVCIGCYVNQKPMDFRVKVPLQIGLVMANKVCEIKLSIFILRDM